MIECICNDGCMLMNTIWLEKNGYGIIRNIFTSVVVLSNNQVIFGMYANGSIIYRLRFDVQVPD